MVQYTPKQLADGRAYLKALLPKAKEELSTHADRSAKAESPVAMAMMPHIKEDNLDALVIHPVATGWHADLLLKRTPPGVSDILGTPTDSPCRTKEEAEVKALDLLCSALDLQRQHKAAPKQRPPSFILYDVAWQLYPEFYERMQTELLGDFPVEKAGYENESVAIERIKMNLDEILPGVRTNQKNLVKRLRNLSIPDRNKLMVVFHLAALSGVYRYPPKRATTATGHTESTTKQ